MARSCEFESFPLVDPFTESMADHQALNHGPMPSLSRDAIVHIWESSKDAAGVIDKGFKIVHCPADYFYLVSHFRVVDKTDSQLEPLTRT